MLRAPRKFEGWTLAEALQRTKAAEHAFEQRRSELWQDLAEERLTAKGSRGRASEASTPILPESWTNLIVKDWDRSIVLEHGTEVEVHNVRVFPILHAEDAWAHTAGRSLSTFSRDLCSKIQKLPFSENKSRGRKIYTSPYFGT